MDAKTPLGQEAILLSYEAIKKFEAHYKDRLFKIVTTQQWEPAQLDGIIVSGDTIRATVEIKVRDFSYAMLLDRFNGEWLMSFSKLRAGMAAHAIHGVGMTGLLYCKSDKKLVVARLINNEGQIGLPTRLDSTETQATVNGGKAHRVNAFIDIRKCMVID